MGIKPHALFCGLIACVFWCAGCGVSGVSPRENLASSVIVESADIGPFTTAQGKQIQAVSMRFKNTGSRPINEMWGQVDVYDAAGNEVQSSKMECLWLHNDSLGSQNDHPTLTPNSEGDLKDGYLITALLTDNATAASAKVVVTKAFETDVEPTGPDDPQLKADGLNAN